MKHFYSVILCLFVAVHVSGQMEINGQLVFGNEWIDYNKQYVKLTVTEDGVYRVGYQELIDGGLSPADLVGRDLQLYHMGEEIPILVSSPNTWGQGDFFLFFGERNDGELDKQLYRNWEQEQLNPYYSMFSDESPYYLTIESGSNNLRYTNIPNDLTGQLPAAETTYQHHERQIYNDFAWSPVAPTEPDASFSNFIVTEGFGTPMRQFHDLSFNLSNIAQGGGARLLMRTGSNAQTNHVAQISINGRVLTVDPYNGNKVRTYDLPLLADDLKENTTVRIEGLGISDNITVSYAEIIYPRTLTADNKSEFWLHPEEILFDRYYELNDFSAGTQNYIFDTANGTVMIPSVSGNTVRWRLKPNGNTIPSQLYLTSNANLKTVDAVKPVSHITLDNLDPQYLIISSEKLNNTNNANNTNPVAAFAEFRESTDGDSYAVEVVNIEDLYELFSYGIPEHSIAIKNLGRYVKDRWSNFEMVFIIGKGLSYGNRNKNTTVNSYVPTYGKPGSDNLFFTSNDSLSYPYVAVGRLPAHKPEDIFNYLDKVVLHSRIADVESLSFEERYRLKQILHLSGGDPQIEDAILDNLNRMKDTIESNLFAGCVTTFKKTSTDPVQTSLSQSIINEVDKGVSIMTFHGHSSAGTFDFSIEDPSKYDNYGSYPMIISMGCHSGDIHETVFSLSEDFVLEKDKGAIVFVAASGNAFINTLGRYGEGKYSRIGGVDYGKPIGTIIRNTLEEQFNSLNTRTITFQQQNNLNGDPALKLYSTPGPDYIVDFGSMRTSKDVGTGDANITVIFDVLNLGAGRQDSLHSYIVHEYGENLTDTVYFSIEAPFNKQEVSVTFKNPGPVALGKNVINVILDYKNEIDEFPDPSGEDNNDLKRAYNNEGFCFFILDNSAFPIYPRNFSIVYDQDLTLYASANNAFAKAETFLFQIDTTETFDSPFLRSTELVSSPSLIQWRPGITMEDETVYYWRVSPKDDSGQSKWNNSSFVFLEDGSEGWNQSHYYQWQKDSYDTYLIDEETRAFLFAEDLKDIRVKNGAFRLTLPGITYQTDNSNYIEFASDDAIASGIYLATFDGVTGNPLTNENPGLYNSHFNTPWAIDWMNFPYKTDTAEERANAMNFIQNVAKEGDYVVFYTIQRTTGQDYDPELWAQDAANGMDLMTLLESHGAQRVRDLEAEAVPYIFVFKKNDPSFAPIEVVADQPTDEISAEFKIVGRWFEGEIQSTVVGPAEQWHKFLWDIDQFNSTEDLYRLDILGRKTNGEEDVLFTDVQEFDFDLTSVNANVYPELRLRFYATDTISLNSPQLQYWRVLYDSKPEAALNINEGFSFNSDTLFLGETLTFNSRATNISVLDMDSLLVKYTILDDNNNEINEFRRFAPLPAKQTIDIDFDFSTDQLLGSHEFRVEINPDMDQPEQYDFNNIGIVDFEVQGDRINPLLDVAFDGLRIMDGDIVSPRPLITVELRDENTFLFVKDINNFDLALQKLPDIQSNPVDLTQPTITFFPADSLNGNVARIEWEAEFEAGEYILYVQAKDASGNLSGDQAIEARFEVITDSQVSNVLNYPNPFSTSTEFVFTLTGYEVPEVFTIQIMTLSGKVVKEITRDMLGDLRIGLNRTDYKWDGTDDFGNRLANGVYLYRVFTSDGQEMYKHFENTDVDSYFKQGFGKLVIMR